MASLSPTVQQISSRWFLVAGVPPLLRGMFVYALYREGRLIYIGRTGNIRIRLMTHRLRFGFDFAKLSECFTEREQKWRERQLLFRLRPCLNRSIPSLLYAEFYYAPTRALWRSR